jgi:enoyl-CoA hydratase
MADSPVSVVREGAVATITIQRPEKLNALDGDVLGALEQAVAEIEATREVRCAILTGAGKAFVAGADIGSMSEMSVEQARTFSERGQRFGWQLESARIPVIAAVNGFALGGGLELALACDFIYASDKAKLGLPEVTLGVIPGFGGTQRLARRVGIGMARELVYSGAMIRADEALRIGLVNRVLPAEELIVAAKQTAEKIAAVGPLAVSRAKRVMWRGESLDLGAACELETTGFAALFDSEDQRAGMAAFLSKEPAQFVGR